MKPVSLSSLVESLHRLDPGGIDTSSVLEVVAGGDLDEASVRPYVGFRADRYARRLVHRSQWFDVMVLSWAPGQVTPIHNHSGQLGWVRLVRGQIEENVYGYPGGRASADLASVDIDDAGVGHGVELVHAGRAVVADVGAVATVDRVRAIHSLGNPGGDGTVTLHVYSRPHDSCLCFDPAQRTCWRRDLAFDGA